MSKQMKWYPSEKVLKWADNLPWGTKSKQINRGLEAFIDGSAPQTVAQQLGQIYLAIMALPSELGKNLSVVVGAPQEIEETTEDAI